jgi:hypothetical protein
MKFSFILPLIRIPSHFRRFVLLLPLPMSRQSVQSVYCHRNGLFLFFARCVCLPMSHKEPCLTSRLACSTGKNTVNFHGQHFTMIFVVAPCISIISKLHFSRDQHELPEDGPYGLKHVGASIQMF